MTSSVVSNMAHTTDPKKDIRDAIGLALDDVTLSGYQVLIGIYTRPEKTMGGIYLTDNTRKEDEYQGKVGLVLKMGPHAFKKVHADDKTNFGGVIPNIDDWVFYRVLDGFDITLNGFRCRILEDNRIRGIVARPDVLM